MVNWNEDHNTRVGVYLLFLERNVDAVLMCRRVMLADNRRLRDKAAIVSLQIVRIMTDDRRCDSCKSG